MGVQQFDEIGLGLIMPPSFFPFLMWVMTISYLVEAKRKCNVLGMFTLPDRCHRCAYGTATPLRRPHLSYMVTINKTLGFKTLPQNVYVLS